MDSEREEDVQEKELRVMRPAGGLQHRLAERTPPVLQRIVSLLPREGVVLAAVLVVVVSVWGFIAIAAEVLEGDTREFDHWVIGQLRRAGEPAVPIGPPWLIEAGREITALGGVTVLCLLVIAVGGYLLQQRAYGAMWFVLIAALEHRTV